MRAWTYQDAKQVKKHGTDKASWYVAWDEPDGRRKCKSIGPGKTGKRDAKRLADKIHSELVTGTYKSASNVVWEQFRKEYTAKIVSGLAIRSQSEIEFALNNFERTMKPKKMSAIKTATVDDFIGKRRDDDGKRVIEGPPGPDGKPTKAKVKISPATINKDLRALKAALRVAHDWGYLPVVPKFRMEREPEKLPSYVTDEHLFKLYEAAEKMERPADLPNITPADWWRALMMFARMTGWRISEILALRWSDVDLAAGMAITRAESNKGKRDEKVPLHPVVVEHLERLKSFDAIVFRWNLDRKMLDNEFHRLQSFAKVKPEYGKPHYGFHDLRRAFGTMNADRMTADALQKLMRHKSYETTKRYVAMARQLNPAVANLHVPNIPTGRTGTQG